MMVRRAIIPRYSLRTLLAVITILSAALGYWIYRVRQQERRQEKQIAAVEDLGGSVTFRHEIADNGVSLPNAMPPRSSWLRGHDQHFDQLVKISLERATDEQLHELGKSQFQSVEHVLLVGSPITDTGIFSLRSETFPRLRRLRLDETEISDAGLAHIADELPYLEKLYVSRTKISNDGIMHLSAMNNLVFLELTETAVDTDGIERLKKSLPRLTISGP